VKSRFVPGKVEIKKGESDRISLSNHHATDSLADRILLL